MSDTARSALAVTPLAALSHELMAALLPDGRIAWANPAWRQPVGWGEEELAGRPFRDLAPDLPRAGEEVAMEVATRSGGRRRIAFTAAHADGLTYLCGRDASRSGELEDELRAAEERFRVITEATHEAIL